MKREAVARILPQYTVLMGDVTTTRTMTEMDFAKNAITYKVPVKMARPTDGTVGVYVELRDASDKSYDPKDYYPEREYTAKVLQVGKAVNLQYPEVRVDITADATQRMTETFDFQMSVIVPNGELMSDAEVMKYVDDIDSVSLSGNNGNIDYQATEYTAFGLTSRGVDFVGIERGEGVAKVKYNVSVGGHEVPDSDKDIFGTSAVTSYHLTAQIGEWQRSGNSQKVDYTYSRPVFDPLDVVVWDYVEANYGKAELHTAMKFKWRVNNVTEDNPVMSYTVRVYPQGDRVAEYRMENTSLQLNDVKQKEYKLSVTGHKQKDWKYIREGEVIESIVPYSDFITENGYHPTVWREYWYNDLLSNFADDALSPLKLAWDCKSASSFKMLKSNETLYEIVREKVLNEKNGMYEVKDMTYEVKQMDVRCYTLPQQDFAYKVVPVDDGNQGMIMLSNDCYYELYTQYDLPYTKYMEREYGE